MGGGHWEIHYSVQCTVYRVQSTVYSVQCTVYNEQCSRNARLLQLPSNLFRKEDGAVYKGRTDVQKDVSKSLDPLIRTTRLAFVITFTMFDITYALYNHYSGTKTNTG